MFFYHSQDLGDLEIEDPTSGQCRLLLQGATSATNKTASHATLYLDRLCEEPTGITLNPGRGSAFTDSIPHSVIFD